MDVPVEVSASISMLPPVIDANVSIGTIDLGSIVLDNVDGHFRIDTTGLLLNLDASLTLPSATGGTSPNIDAALDITANTSGFNAHFEGSASNWKFGPFATIDSFTIKGDLPQFALSIEGNGHVLGTAVGIKGDVAFAGIELQTASLQVNAGPITIGGPAPLPSVSVTGAGCDGIRGGSGSADDGACARVGYDRSRANPFSGLLSGEVSINGATASFTGSLDNKGVNVSDASIKFGSSSLTATGRFYSGTAADLAGTTETLPTGGPAVQVRTGDWRVSMAAQTSTKLAGFNASLKTSVGSINNTVFFTSQGTASMFGNTIDVTNALTFSGGALHFNTVVNVNLTLDGVALGSGQLTISDTGVTFTGQVSLDRFGPANGALTVTLTGSFTAPVGSIPARYHLSADVTAQVITAAVDLHVVLDSITGFDLNFRLDSGPIDVTFNGSVSTSLKVCASATATVVLPSFPDPTGTFAFCNKGTAAERGLALSLTVSGYTLSAKLTTPSIHFERDFSFSGSAQTPMIGFLNPIDWKDDFKLGASIEFDVEVTVDSNTGVSFDGSGSAAAFYKHWHDLDPDLFGEDWEFGKHTIGSLGVRVHPDNREACTDVGFFGVTREVCI